MKKLLRDAKIKLNMVDQNKWEIANKDGELLVNADTDYIIYMQNVNFKKGNIIEGRYLGALNENSPLLQVENAKQVITDGGKFIADGKQVRTAKMVVVNNKTNVIIVISNDR